MLSPKDLHKSREMMVVLRLEYREKRGAKSLNVLYFIKHCVIPLLGFTRNSTISTFDTITIEVISVIANRKERSNGREE